MLEYNEIKERKIIIFNNEPCEVLESHVARTQQRKPQNQVKLKSLISGRTYNTTFQSSDSAEEAGIDKKEIKFLYHNKGEFWFSDPNDGSKRFKLESNLIGDLAKYLKENTLVTAMTFEQDDEEEKIIKIILPIKVEFKVKEAPPAVKGNTAQGGNKVAILENGTSVSVPLFINEGDVVVINTTTGEYSERASK